MSALGVLAQAGHEFNFVAAVGGHRAALRELVRRVGASAPLAARTTLFPLLAPWRIPSLLRSLDVACFLERAFSVRRRAKAGRSGTL